MSDGIRNFIFENSYKNKKNHEHHKIFNFIDLYVKDSLPENVNILEVIQEVESKIPFFLVNEVEAFYVGDFKEFREKQVNAMYRDGAIYVSNDQDNVLDMVDDIVHEIAHAVEEIFSQTIYSDGKVQNEFLGKRQRLKDLLKEYGHLGDNGHLFSQLEYSKELDDFLYQTLGYENVETFSIGLFVRPYAITDVREYFASAFEEYLLGDMKYLKKLSPVVYDKIELVYKSGS